MWRFFGKSFIAGKQFPVAEKRHSLARRHMTWNYVFAVLPVVYSIFCHYKYGMTIGKWVARRAIHDFIAGTVVVRIDEFERRSLMKESFNSEVVE
jgi:uncharacterized RDD family membrane protein YckC